MHASSRMGVDQGHDDKMKFYRIFEKIESSKKAALGLSFSEFIKSCSFNGRDCLQES